MALPDADAIVGRYLPVAGYPEAEDYLRFHRRRFAELVALVDALAPQGRPFALLDVGPSFQTRLFRDELRNARVDTLGFPDPRFEPRPGERHIEFDLNDAEHPERWLPPAAYEVVVCAEVIEHLVAAPTHVLRLLATQLAPAGRLVLQTPNAVSLYKRAKMVLGRHPFDQLREDSSNAGHIREHTIGELLGYADAAGLRVLDWAVSNSLAHERRLRHFVRLERVLPARLRDATTVVLARP